jgi:hypothetical protein
VGRGTPQHTQAGVCVWAAVGGAALGATARHSTRRWALQHRGRRAAMGLGGMGWRGQAGVVGQGDAVGLLWVERWVPHEQGHSTHAGGLLWVGCCGAGCRGVGQKT